MGSPATGGIAVNGGIRTQIVVGLLAGLFLVAAGLHVWFALALSSGGPTTLFGGPHRLGFWLFNGVTHPWFAVPWGALIAVAAIQFAHHRAWGRAVLEVAAWLVLAFLSVAWALLVAGVVRGILYALASPYGGPVHDMLAFALVPLVPWALCLLTIRVLRSPKVRAAMLDRPRRG